MLATLVVLWWGGCGDEAEVMAAVGTATVVAAVSGEEASGLSSGSSAVWLAARLAKRPASLWSRTVGVVVVLSGSGSGSSTMLAGRAIGMEIRTAFFDFFPLRGDPRDFWKQFNSVCVCVYVCVR